MVATVVPTGIGPHNIDPGPRKQHLHSDKNPNFPIQPLVLDSWDRQGARGNHRNPTSSLLSRASVRDVL